MDKEERERRLDGGGSDGWASWMDEWTNGRVYWVFDIEGD